MTRTQTRTRHSTWKEGNKDPTSSLRPWRVVRRGFRFPPLSPARLPLAPALMVPLDDFLGKGGKVAFLVDHFPEIRLFVQRGEANDWSARGPWHDL